MRKHFAEAAEPSEVEQLVLQRAQGQAVVKVIRAVERERANVRGVDRRRRRG
jgi:hypothetical protein